jgi:hypothetical protein
MISNAEPKTSKSRLTSTTAALPVESPLDELQRIVAPLFEAARESSSLLANEYLLKLGDVIHRLPKFLLLGTRGGGKPMHVGLFAGFEGGSLETTDALSEALLQFKASPSLTRDYALSAYPIVNLAGLASPSEGRDEFEARYARKAADEDVQLFLREFRLWNFDGLISVRRDARTRGFYATVRSEIIAREVVEEAMAAASTALPLAAQPVRIHSSDSRNGNVAPRFAPPAELRSRLFDIELHLPATDRLFDQADALYVTIAEILRHYRTFIVHAREM